MLFRSNDTATTEIYTTLDTLSLHDALPISAPIRRRMSLQSAGPRKVPVQLRTLSECSLRRSAVTLSSCRAPIGQSDPQFSGKTEHDAFLLACEIDRCLSPPLANPRDNPFDSLIAVYLVAKLPERGIQVRLAGRIDPDPGSGRDRKSTRLNSSHPVLSRMPSSA